MKNSEKRMERDRIESSRKEKNFCDDDCFVLWPGKRVLDRHCRKRRIENNGRVTAPLDSEYRALFGRSLNLNSDYKLKL